MGTKVVVVVIRSLSYTGTTWLNTVLGCHPNAMALGPADRLWKAAQGNDIGPLCLIHRPRCEFWDGFLAQFSKDKNLFAEVARYCGKSVLITNNLIPTGAGTQLDHPEIETRHIQLARDGRAVAASYSRKFADKSFAEALTGFLQPSLHHFPFDPANPTSLAVRYEDLMADQLGQLHRIGTFLGIEYQPSALRFWEWRHHLVHGNPGFAATLRMGEGLPVDDFEDLRFYRAQFERMRQEGPQAFHDDRAVPKLSRLNLYLFDLIAGADNARLGYPRDRFTETEIKAFEPYSKILESVSARYRSSPI